MLWKKLTYNICKMVQGLYQKWEVATSLFSAQSVSQCMFLLSRRQTHIYIIYIYMLMLARIFNICILLKNIFILCQLQGCNFMSAFSFHIPRHWQKQSNHETSTFTNANHSNSYKKNIFYLLNWVCVINRHSKKMNPQPVKDRLLSIQPARECRYKWC